MQRLMPHPYRLRSRNDFANHRPRLSRIGVVLLGNILQKPFEGVKAAAQKIADLATVGRTERLGLRQLVQEVGEFMSARHGYDLMPFRRAVFSRAALAAAGPT